MLTTPFTLMKVTYDYGMENTIKSMFTLGWNDFGKGLVVAFLGGALMVLQQELTAHIIIWTSVLDAGLISGVGYLIKNFFTDSQGKFGGIIG